MHFNKTDSSLSGWDLEHGGRVALVGGGALAGGRPMKSFAPAKKTTKVSTSILSVVSIICVSFVTLHN